jgi:hypothetical protein
MNMVPKSVEKLEGKIEESIAEIIVRMGLKRLPLLPSRHTMHLMAKAAVAVYEAAVENAFKGMTGKMTLELSWVSQERLWGYRAEGSA